MAIETRIDEETYLRLSFAQPDLKWELVDGRLREKPAMTFRHNWWEVKLGHFLLLQLDWSQYQVRVDAGRVRKPGATYYIPDVFVLPVAFGEPFRDRDDILEVYSEPLPLVVEVWSRSTGDYDVEEKLADYQQRGDLEIWRLHPFERTLTRWVRQADGSYEETLHRGGVVRLVALSGVAIDLDALFAD
ncbi:MAG: Uma2 family endonuclease [Chloroflexia bacterium]|nr:Uma2 family endonuclease [Chloroflexia bacterium]